MPREKVGIYTLLSVVMAAVTDVSQELGSALLLGAVFAVIGLISYNQFQKEGELFDTLQGITPLWIVTVTGICAGKRPMLVFRLRKTANERDGAAHWSWRCCL